MLRATRVQHGLEQTDVAIQAGIERTRLSRIESGKLELKLTEARKLAKVLKLELDAIIDEMHASGSTPSDANSSGDLDDLGTRIQALDPDAQALVDALVRYLSRPAP